MTKPYKLIGECVSPIATPLADPLLAKIVFKMIRGATKLSKVRRGVKEVVKSIRKGEHGIIILAADVSPVDVLSHLPVLCEDASIPYVFVRSKLALGLYSATKRPTSCLIVHLPEGLEYQKHYQEAYQQIVRLDNLSKLPRMLAGTGQ